MRSAFVVGRKTRKTTTLYLLPVAQQLPQIVGPWTLTAVVSAN